MIMMKDTESKRTALLRVLPFALALTVGQPLHAASYDVEHNFSLRPGGNVVPRVTGIYYAHSYIQEKRGDCEDFAVAPSQGAAFNPYGKDILRNRRGRVRNRGVGGRYRDVTNGSIAVGAGGISEHIQAFTYGCLSIADANSSITVNPYGAGSRVTGSIRAWGEARAALRPPRRSKAYAFSMTLVEAQGGRAMRNGRIRWGRVVRDLVAGRASARRQVDPIDYTVTDLKTGEVHTGTLYTVTIDILKAGGGGFTWENDKVAITARDVDFKIAFPTKFTSMQGSLDLRVREGKVTHAEATGHYAGVLAPVGTTVPIEFPLGDTEEFDYDLGDFDGHDLDVSLEFSGAGEAEEARAADPELTVTVPSSTPSEAITLSFPPQNCPVVLQQSTNLNRWDNTDMTHVLRSHQNGLETWTVPVEPGRSMFFRLQTREDQVTDIDPPKFLAEAACGQPMVLINYSEPVMPDLAQDPFLYLVTDESGLLNPVLDARMLAPDTVMLFLEQPVEPWPGLRVMVLEGIADLAGNPMRPNQTAPIACDQTPVPLPDQELPFPPE
jgi:hypothetical protein